MTDPRPLLRGMILAAGHGSRLAPLTDHLPKPLLPVGGVTLLDRAAAALARAGIRDIAVNTHHLGGMIAAHLEARTHPCRFTVFPEVEILGTGGALDGARAFLRDADHFLIHNGDVLGDADLAGLVRNHLDHGALATLLLVDWPAANSVALDAEGRVRRIGGDRTGDGPRWRRLTYTGIGVFRRDLLDDIGPGFSSLIDPLVRALARDPDSVRGQAPASLTWSDLGTPARYLAALPGDETDPRLPLQVRRITGHGSQRRFWRLQAGAFSCVAMVSPADDTEFSRFIAIGRWLHEQGLGAPALLAENAAERSVLMEDLGPRSLGALAAADPLGPARDQALRPVYGQVVDHLLRLQSRTGAARSGCPEAVDRTLDHAQLRWETDYFRERFLAGHCGLAGGVLAALTPEFEELARAVARQPLVLIHRDFQSANIHLKAGRVGLVDFQGLRLGPLGYDIMSLVQDPYVDLSEGLKRELLDRFCRGAAGGGDPAAVRAMALAAGLQRLMQALGAYGFLGHVKGKTEFLAHIPRGLAHLRGLLDRLEADLAAGDPALTPWLPAGGLPRLTALVRAELPV